MKIPQYAVALDDALGAGADKALSADLSDEFASVAERIYINWLQTAVQT